MEKEFKTWLALIRDLESILNIYDRVIEDKIGILVEDQKDIK